MLVLLLREEALSGFQRRKPKTVASAKCNGEGRIDSHRDTASRSKQDLSIHRVELGEQCSCVSEARRRCSGPTSDRVLAEANCARFAGLHPAPRAADFCVMSR